MGIRDRLKLGLLTVVLLGFGYVALFAGLGRQEAFDATLDHGIKTMAEVTKVSRFGKGESHFDALISWRVPDGALRRGRIEISSAFYEQITGGDLQTVKIRYLADYPHLRPVILADIDQGRWHYREGIILGTVFLVAGALSGFLLLRLWAHPHP